MRMLIVLLSVLLGCIASPATHRGVLSEKPEAKAAVWCTYVFTTLQIENQTSALFHVVSRGLDGMPAITPVLPGSVEELVLQGEWPDDEKREPLQMVPVEFVFSEPVGIPSALYAKEIFVCIHQSGAAFGRFVVAEDECSPNGISLDQVDYQPSNDMPVLQKVYAPKRLR